MDINIFGYKFRLELIILIVILAIIINSTLLCSCSKVSSVQEGMAVLDYKMGEGVHSSWDTKEQTTGSSVNWRKQDHDTYHGGIVHPDESLGFFSNTQFKPECCGSNYASSGGCACMNKQQMDYINTRGGNRTHPGI
jgi:hypothetical protein